MRDTTMLASAVITTPNVQLALLFGLLCGKYQKHPDAMFWDVVEGFLNKRLRV